MSKFFFNKTVIPLSSVFRLIDLNKFFEKNLNFDKIYLKIDEIFNLFVVLFKYRGFLKYYIYNKYLLKNIKLVHKFFLKCSKKFGLNLVFFKTKFPFLKFNLHYLKNRKKFNSLKILPFIRFNKNFLSVLSSFFDQTLDLKKKFNFSKKKLNFFFYKRRKQRTKFLLRFSKFF